MNKSIISFSNVASEEEFSFAYEAMHIYSMNDMNIIQAQVTSFCGMLRFSDIHWYDISLKKYCTVHLTTITFCNCL